MIAPWEEDFIRLAKPLSYTKDVAKHLNRCNATIVKLCCKLNIKSQYDTKLLKFDIMNQKFGKLTAIRNTLKKQKNNYIWECLCECGKTCLVKSSLLRTNKRKNCGCTREGKLHHRSKNFGEISSRAWTRIKSHALERGIDFQITPEQANALFLQQSKKCYYSGIELKFAQSIKEGEKATTASLDRIDSSKGYIEGNIQWVHKVVNNMKNNLSDKDFIEWCKNIYLNRGT